MRSRRIHFVFGIEPSRLRREQIRAILRTVYEGHVEARYWSAFGRLLHADGRLLADVGIPYLNRMKRIVSLLAVCDALTVLAA